MCLDCIADISSKDQAIVESDAYGDIGAKKHALRHWMPSRRGEVAGEEAAVAVASAFILRAWARSKIPSYSVIRSIAQRFRFILMHGSLSYARQDLPQSQAIIFVATLRTRRIAN